MLGLILLTMRYMPKHSLVCCTVFELLLQWAYLDHGEVESHFFWNVPLVSTRLFWLLQIWHWSCIIYNVDLPSVNTVYSLYPNFQIIAVYEIYSNKWNLLCEFWSTIQNLFSLITGMLRKIQLQNLIDDIQPNVQDCRKKKRFKVIEKAESTKISRRNVRRKCVCYSCTCVSTIAMLILLTLIMLLVFSWTAKPKVHVNGQSLLGEPTPRRPLVISPSTNVTTTITANFPLVQQSTTSETEVAIIQDNVRLWIGAILVTFASAIAVTFCCCIANTDSHCWNRFRRNCKLILYAAFTRLPAVTGKNSYLETFMILFNQLFHDSLFNTTELCNPPNSLNFVFWKTSY